MTRFGAALVFSLDWSADILGAAALEYQAAATEAALAPAAWTAYPAGSTVAGRWIRLRWTVSGDGSEALRMDHLCWAALAPTASRRLFDLDTATLSGTAATGRIVPHDLALVTQVILALQGAVSGYTWAVANKNNPTRIMIWDAAGEPADATVDLELRGVAA